MRRRHHPRARPALIQRAIVAYPEPSLSAVESFRRDHDPLAARVPAHVTLVFPFASSLSDVQVIAHAKRVARRWPQLPIALSGVDAYTAQWVHLRVTRGREAITELHDRLYRGALAPFLRREFEYDPHVTIGRAANAGACDGMLDAARSTFRRPLTALLRELHVVALLPDAIEPRAAIPLGGS